MRSIETKDHFPLSSVKPLEHLAGYRTYCLTETRRAFQAGAHRRLHSPISGEPLQKAGEVEGFLYLRCPTSGSLFLAGFPNPEAWADLLSRVNRYRHSPDTFHLGLSQSRTDHVYFPKVEWIEETLALQGMRRPRILEAVIPPSDLSALLRRSGAFSSIEPVDEMHLAHGEGMGDPSPRERFQVALLLESLDRSDEPVGLIQQVCRLLESDGLLFVTALVSSGFDMEVLGLSNQYLYPPDRANCFSLDGLKQLLQEAGFSLLEVSTPGVLDLEIVQAHLQADPSMPLPGFVRQILGSSEEARTAFQAFLQQQGFSSFARIVARKKG